MLEQLESKGPVARSIGAALVLENVCITSPRGQPMTLSLSKLTRFKSSYDVLGYLLRLMSLIWHRHLNAGLAKIGLTEMQFVLMMGLGWLTEKKPKGVSQRELAEACGCSTALASQVLQKLHQKKYVSVRSDPYDARARMVKLTMSGEEKLREACVILENTDAEFRGDDPEVAQALFDALRAAIEIKMKNVTQPGRELGAMPLDIDLLSLRPDPD